MTPIATFSMLVCALRAAAGLGTQMNSTIVAKAFFDQTAGRGGSSSRRPSKRHDIRRRDGPVRRRGIGVGDVLARPDTLRLWRKRCLSTPRIPRRLGLWWWTALASRSSTTRA